MHNTDRTQMYMESGEFNTPGFSQSEYQPEYQPGYQGEYQPGYQGEYMSEFESEFEFIGELVNPMTGEVNQEAELALAAELLSVTNEAELNQFLGGLIKKVGRTFKKVGRSGLGRILGGSIRSLAKAALPTLGGALGSMIPIPGVGTALGAAAASAAGNALGLEFEGLSHEDREFEIARRIVRVGVEGARALESMQESEFLNEYEIGAVLKSIASRVLPTIGSAVLGGLTGQAAGGGQGSGGLAGGVQVTSPGGWNVQVGGQAGGQFSGGAAAGVNAPAPQVPFQQPGRRPVAPPVRPGAGHATGRWIRRGRHILLLNAY